MRISEAIQYLEPDEQTTIRDMVSKAGLNGDATVGQLFDAYSNTESMTRDQMLAMLGLNNSQPNRFAPKLTFEQRCQVLALHRRGIKTEVLSKMFAINRRTVTHICTDNSPHYKNVRKEEVGLGSRFAEKYLTLDLVEKAMAYVTAENEGQTTNNKYASHKRGVHLMCGSFCTFNHRVEIKWLEPDGDIQIAGWYYKDLDGDFPDRWFTRGEADMKTSQACYNAALEEISDKLK